MARRLRWLIDPCCERVPLRAKTRQTIMDVLRETPDVTTKPKCYDFTSILAWHPWRRRHALLLAPKGVVVVWFGSPLCFPQQLAAREMRRQPALPTPDDPVPRNNYCRMDAD